VSLGLATGGELGRATVSRPRQMVVTSGLARVFLVGAVAGVLLLGDLLEAALLGFYGGEAVALLYLAAEELRSEATRGGKLRGRRRLS